MPERTLTAPLLATLPTQSFIGLETRTTNALEANPSTANIPNTWQQFFAHGFAQSIPAQTSSERLYGLYTRYESDFRGAYSMIVAAEVTPDAVTPNQLTKIEIPAAKYLIFAGTGEMPQAVVQVWQQVWQFFAPSECLHQRAYTTDFEVYDSTRPNTIEIYIAIFN